MKELRAASPELCDYRPAEFPQDYDAEVEHSSGGSDLWHKGRLRGFVGDTRSTEGWLVLDYVTGMGVFADEVRIKEGGRASGKEIVQLAGETC